MGQVSEDGEGGEGVGVDGGGGHAFRPPWRTGGVEYGGLGPPITGATLIGGRVTGGMVTGGTVTGLPPPRTGGTVTGGRLMGGFEKIGGVTFGTLT